MKKNNKILYLKLTLYFFPKTNFQTNLYETPKGALITKTTKRYQNLDNVLLYLFSFKVQCFSQIILISNNLQGKLQKPFFY